MGKFLYLYFILFLIPAALFAASGDGSLEFVANKGQWAEPFRYRVNTGNTDVFLENNAFTYLVGAQDNFVKIKDEKFGKTETANLKFHAYKMVFVGGNTNPDIQEGRSQKHYYNYYLGNDPQRWKSDIHPCLDVDYKNIYSNVNLHVSSEESNLKYDFIVAAGTDPEVIKLRYDGAEKVSLKDGKLQILTSVGTVEEMRPFAYQEINGQQVKVFCRYKLSNNVVSYSFPDGYDKTKELIIDPTVVFATFTGSAADNWGFTATYDAGGNFYAGGIALAVGYPLTTGAFQTTWGNGAPIYSNLFACDISISKFNSLGNALMFSTYLGGAANEQPHSLIVDPSGNLIVAGRTYSNNFPTTAGCYDNSYNGNGDLIVTKFNSTGTGLVGSTYVGGSEQDITNDTAYEFGWGNLKHNYGDDARSEVIVDQSGNIYVAACTRSTDFPTTFDAIKTTLSSGDVQDGVVLELNSSLTSLVWSTYLGGDADDAAYVLALDKTGANLFVAGGTMSGNFPATTGSYTPSYQGNVDGFIAKFVNGPGHTLARSTYIGKSGYDQCYGIQVDNNNNVYAMGQTMGGTFPVSAGVYSNPNSSQFIIKMNSTLTTNVQSTVFGSGNPNATNISPVAFLVDSCGNIYVSGWGGNLYGSNPPPGTGNTFGMPINGSAGPAAQSTTDGEDFYFIVLSQNMGSLVYGTYMGSAGAVGEHVDGGTSRFDRNGIVYQAICGGCGKGTFPTTAGAYSTTNKSNNCNLVALKIAFDLGAVRAAFTVSPNGVVCLGSPFTITNTSVNGINFIWDFGDGFVTSANTPPPHTYTSVGTYVIKLRASNPNACNSVDSAKITVKVDTNAIIAAFKATVIDTCAPYTASFTNLSKLSNTPAGTVFNWSFGDGGSFTGANPPNHNYPGGGTFTIKLLMTDPAACNSPDSASATVTFRDDLVKASFDVQPLVCLGDSFAPSNTSEKALTYLWTFGDNSTSTLARPFHKFDAVGSYKVTLYAYNPETCNKVDSTSKTIEVKPSPVADFSFTPTVPVTNEISRFTNLSKNAVSYNWDFGDGTGTEEENPEHFYKRTGTYTVCLVAMNKEGCTDTICKNVPADILPLADIPNGFSPNGDGNNDILYVYGAAIEKIDLKIYNRWGQMVFESHDIKNGWDGTFKGKPQEVEAYAYVLNVTFIDETTLFKKGNVTLLR